MSPTYCSSAVACEKRAASSLCHRLSSASSSGGGTDTAWSPPPAPPSGRLAFFTFALRLLALLPLPLAAPRCTSTNAWYQSARLAHFGSCSKIDGEGQDKRLHTSESQMEIDKAEEL